MGDPLTAAIAEVEKNIVCNSEVSTGQKHPETYEKMFVMTGQILEYHTAANKQYTAIETALGNDSPALLFASNYTVTADGQLAAAPRSKYCRMCSLPATG